MEIRSNNSVCFDKFEIDLERRRLLRDGEVVALKPKAFDLLVALAENRGELLSKDRLFEMVWADQIVEENNLTVHIAAVRKALGEKRGEHRFIVTVPGKGYRFIGETRPAEVTELVVETHTFQKITIEEEIEEQPVPPAMLGRKPSRHWPLIAVGVAAALLIVMAAAVIVPKLNGQNAGGEYPFENGRFRRLTNNGVVNLAAMSPDGTRFAYSTNDRGLQGLYVGEVSSGDPIELRPPSLEEYFDIEIAADGSGLYFTSRANASVQPTLYRMPLLGGPAVKIREGVRNFELSPNAKEAAFAKQEAGTRSSYILKFPVAGGDEVEILSLARPIFEDTLAWSPDGSRLAVAASSKIETFDEIVMVSAEGGEPESLRRPEWKEIRQISWLHDNSGFAVAALEASSWAAVPQYRIYRVALSSDPAKAVTDDLSSYGAGLDLSAASAKLLTIETRQLNNVWIAPAGDLAAAKPITKSSFGRYDGLWGLGWMPDGSLVYTTSDTHSQVIARMNADGSGQKVLTAPGSVDSALDVSRDGSFVVFHSSRGGGFDIWRMNTDGSDIRQLTFSKSSFQPFISPDGAWVYYKWIEDGKAGLGRVSSTGGEPEVIDQIGTSWGSFSPDGGYFAASFFKDKLKLALYSATTHELLREFELPPTGITFVGIGWMPDGRSIMYRDKESGYWVQPIEGGPPRPLEGMPDERLYNFKWSNDGQFLAFVRGQVFRDVVLMSPEWALVMRRRNEKGGRI